MNPFEIQAIIGKGGEGYSTLIIYINGRIVGTYEWGYKAPGRPYSVLYLERKYKGTSFGKALIEIFKSEWKGFKVRYVDCNIVEEEKV